jgi:beta-galactosidase
VVDLGGVRAVDGLLYVPRQDSPNGRVRDFEIRTSANGHTWSEIVANGRWQNDTTFKYVPLSSRPARYVQLRGLNEVEGRPVMSAAEVSIESQPAPSTQ